MVMCASSADQVAPISRSPLVFSVLLSIASVGPTLAVWAAGSHKLGTISRVWQFVSVPGLLLMTLCMLLLSATCLRLGIRKFGIGQGIAPAVLLAICAMPFAVWSARVVSQKVLGLD